MYLHERENWWQFHYNTELIKNKLGPVKSKQERVLELVSSLEPDLQNQVLMKSMSMELADSFRIEREALDETMILASVAFYLGVNTAHKPHTVDGMVEMLLDSTQNFDAPLSDERLFLWQQSLLSAKPTGIHSVCAGKYRSGEVCVASGMFGCEKKSYEAPDPERVPDEMHRFIDWVNSDEDETTDSIIKAAIAHLWFVSVHPFDDGNGRTARLITNMLLARSVHSKKLFYSLSTQMNTQRKQYFEQLRKAQKGAGDITEWLLWFIDCFDMALTTSEEMVSSITAQKRFWTERKGVEINGRQKKVVNLLFDCSFVDKLTIPKYSKIAKCSKDVAEQDILDLIEKRVLIKNDDGVHQPDYLLVKLEAEE